MKSASDRLKVRTNLPSLIFLFVYLVFSALLCYVLKVVSLSYSNYETFLFPWIMLSLLINIVGFLVIYKVSFSDGALWYILVSYLFMFGHIFLVIFDLKTSLIWNPGIYFSQAEKVQGAIFSLLSLNFISLGYFFNSSFKTENQPKSINPLEENNANQNMFTIGKIIFVIGFLCTVLNYYTVVTSTFRAGSYTAYAQIAGSTGVLDDLAFLIIPGVAFILCSRKLSSRSAWNFTLAICFIFLVTMIFSGSRKTQLFSILSIFLCYYWVYGKKKRKPTSVISGTVLGFLLLNLIYIIREYRNHLEQIIPEFFKSIVTLEFLKRIVGETVAETGLSMYSVVSIVKYVPSVFSYEYGMTFLRGLLAIFPLGSVLPNFFNHGYSTFVINKYTGIPVGSSLIGDFYWNFGLWGSLLFCFFFGLVLSRVGRLKGKGGYHEPLYFSILFIIFICIRAGIMDIARPLAIVTIIPLIIKNFILVEHKK